MNIDRFEGLWAEDGAQRAGVSDEAGCVSCDAEETMVSHRYWRRPMLQQS